MTGVSTPLTVRLPDDVRRGLEELAEQTGQSLSELVSEALAQFLAYVQAENAVTEAALAEIDAGASLIPHEAVVAWMESLGLTISCHRLGCDSLGSYRLRQLREIHAYIAEQDPGTAAVVLSRIRNAAQTVDQFPLAGRPGWTRNTREIVVPRTPYIVIYRATGALVVIVRIRHGAQRWPAS